MASSWTYPIDSTTTPVPPDYLLNHVDAAVRYGRGCWKAMMTGDRLPDPVTMFTATYTEELRHMASVFAEAASNTGITLLFIPSRF